MSDYFDRVERQLIRNVEAGVPSSRRSPVRLEHLGLIAAVLVVVAVVAVFLGVHGPRQSGSPDRARGGEVVLAALPPDPGVASGQSLERSVAILRARVDAVLPGVRVTRAGDEVVATAPRRSDIARIIALSAPGFLEFYDWEANVLISSGADAGKTVASRLHVQDAAALLISQGGSMAPGSPGAGSLGLYQAVELAHKQPIAPTSPRLSRFGPVYYLFGAPGSAACKLASHAQHTSPVAGVHCLLAGPGNSVEVIQQELIDAFGGALRLSQGQLQTVPQGTIVLQAADPDSNKPVAINAPSAQFYVLKDDYSLQGTNVTNPRESTDQVGNADVELSFTSLGQLEFSNVTKQIARRGLRVSASGRALDQHFAVALDGKLITVAAIDFAEYPEGISGDDGADIVGGLTRASALDLATMLRFGPLPVTLVVR